MRSPSAGNTQATDLVVLEGPSQTATYWDVTLPGRRRENFGHPGLLRAPVLVIPVVDPDAYIVRYGESDKSSTGLGEGPGRWPVPYWFADAAFASMLIMLAAADEGLGCLFFGIFDHERAVRLALGIPDGRRLLGTIALGYPSTDERPGRSVNRRRRTVDEVVHRGGW